MINVEERLVEALDRAAEAVAVTFTAKDVTSATRGRNSPTIQTHHRWILVATAVLIGLVTSWALLMNGDSPSHNPNSNPRNWSG
ncbi:MAG: hypothetical protein V3V01_06440, partial [Acidimicrobiales bacterium]